MISCHKNSSVCFFAIVTILFNLITIANSSAQKTKPLKPVLPVTVGDKGKLEYNPDSLGNRIPDFSYCGYKASEETIPDDVAVKITVPLKEGDATNRIQSAIDYVASLPLDKNGFRGVVLLEKGAYHISGQLQIKASGIVLRGVGYNEDGTILSGDGTDRQTLIRIFGKNNKKDGIEIKVMDDYVPVNANVLHIASTGTLKVGDEITVRRPSTKEWIHEIETEHFGGGITALGWKPGERDIFFTRKIVAVNGNEITIDVPLTTALDKKFGGGFVSVYQWAGRISNVGIENLQLNSTYEINNPKDEAHRWMAITVENAEDVWVRRVVFQHFAGSAVRLLETTKRVTVEDCKSFNPVSEIGGQRRYTFYTTGEQTLFQRCYSEYGYHDFAVGFCAPGPNAFVQCQSFLPYNFSGGIDSWASGILFDVVSIDGNALRYGNRGQDASGAGWSAANSMFWNCSASRIDCYKPPTAQNWSYASWAQFSGDGYWYGSNESINPRSFYYTQLSNRLNKNVDAISKIMFVESEASSSPTVQQASELTAQSVKPRVQLPEWIDINAAKESLNIKSENIKTIDQVGFVKTPAKLLAPALMIQNGWIVRGNSVLTGARQEVPWWNGGVERTDLKNAKYAITRFVPGRTGKGWTDDLDEMTDSLVAQHIIGLEQHYALWYERRRDDHERIRRMDGEVWPPFYELPFARTGKDFAWDGLSKYDLTKYNQWYWSRIKQYADFADQKGLVLVHENYFQHNIIEAGAHYADFPWRTANNINNTGFPEPPPFAGDKRIFMAEQFYDISDANRKALHTKYIRQCLDACKNNNGVIQLIGEEFTGPLHFVKFWLDVVKDWEKETGNKQLIGLSVTKDVQDAILADAAYADVINVIDVKYWHYQFDGSVYAPPGGQNLAPRQWARLMKPKRSSFEQVYRAVNEYKQRYPSKAVIYSGEGLEFGWAVLMAGGSLANVPVLPVEFLQDASSMHVASLTDAKNVYALNNKESYIIYVDTPDMVAINVSDKNNYLIKWIDAKTGKLIGDAKKAKGSEVKNMQRPSSGAAVAWIKMFK
jgi:hypothetical protein